MPKCIECKKDLKKGSFEKSSPRESNSKEAFIKCSCGNVMIGTFGSFGVLKELTPTPKIKNKATDDMIEEAKRLFKEAGKNVDTVNYSQEVDKVEDEEPEEEVEDMGHTENSIEDEEFTKDVPKSEPELTKDVPDSVDDSAIPIDPCSVCPLFLESKDTAPKSKCGSASVRVRGLKRLLYILGEEE